MPPGYYNIGTMLANVVRHRNEISACGTCMDARGIADADLAPGVRRGTLEQLTDWTLWSDRVLVF